MNENIGIIAGQVWQYLSEHESVTTLKLKSALGVSNTLLCLALGWLAREDKIDFVQTGNTYTVSLKK